jgi:hypothetical protein
MGDFVITMSLVIAAVGGVSLLIWCILLVMKNKSSNLFLALFIICFVAFFPCLYMGGAINKADAAESGVASVESGIVDVFTPETDVSSAAEISLMAMAENVAQQISNYPATVNFNEFAWGFWRNDHVYAVQGTFTCTNAFGVKEEHVLKLVCETSEDNSSISAKEVYLDGTLIKSGS